MADQITAQPPVLDLSFYAGDGISFRLICTDNNDAPIDITGTVEAQIRVDRTPESTPVEEFSANLDDATDGIIVLSLTGEQSQNLIDDASTKKGVFAGVWDIQWTATGAEPRTLCQGKVECLADVTR